MPSPPTTAGRYLWVVRHGKAASDAPWGAGDRERPLTARGRRDATALGRRLAEEVPPLGLDGVVLPELAVCSAAVRTRQTAELILAQMQDKVPLDAYRSLYEAETDVVMHYVREVDEAVVSLLLVGHNPSMYRLVWELTDGDGTAHDRLEAHGFPTCSVAVLALGVGAWEDVVHGCATLAGLLGPPY
ncbi:MAG: SixA phosphatase family protein [Acidimicrobiales bacterium]